MKTFSRILLYAGFLAPLFWLFPAGHAETSASQNAPANELFIGGAGGVYFLADPGELTVEVLKRDLNRNDTRTELRAILVGPDRRVLQEEIIPDDGRPRGSGLGLVQRCRLPANLQKNNSRPCQWAWAFKIEASDATSELK